MDSPKILPDVRVGQQVRMLVETIGDDDDVEKRYPVGAKGVVVSVDHYPGQGRAVTITIEKSITNTFDEADDGGPFFEVLQTKTYLVRQYRDAWQLYEATVTAETAEEALKKARNDEIDDKWMNRGVEEFDDRHMEVFDDDGEVIATDFP